MQEELKKAEELLPKITQHKIIEQKLKDETSTLVKPNIEKINAIKNSNKNYNKGIKYIFKQKELTHDAKIRIMDIPLQRSPRFRYKVHHDSAAKYTTDSA